MAASTFRNVRQHSVGLLHRAVHPCFAARSLAVAAASEKTVHEPHRQGTLIPWHGIWPQGDEQVEVHHCRAEDRRKDRCTVSLALEQVILRARHSLSG